MTGSTQKRLAIAVALVVVLGVVAANAHLVAVAIGSQPECKLAAGAMPARRDC
ncbi:hypothetical protein [Seohaeicola zhoushanensis]|uniref:Uncharacterized protein n=1 Tax=Seohaeicola zhoushanensis TaxID=1569283 RepID=A0A8J3MA55_9RHOB|nr:hypothetical protein [Seohaeicola zhoushanensis]GHF74019.1 hypothetical protein GCM10017056_50920 [Seohaeicola zhoushanensis]